MNGDGVLEIVLIGIIVIILVLISILVVMHYKDKMQKNKEENKEQAPKEENLQSDKKSVFRFMEFDEIEDNMIVQDSGKRYLMVVECKGINYDLLSGLEKNSVEEGFIQFLNTLKSDIQLYIQTRKVNLNQSTQRYRERLELIRQDLQAEEYKYQELQRSGTASKEEILKSIREVTKKRNLYEYGRDVVENTEQMSADRDITTKQYYIVIPYYTDEITSSGDFDKREIGSMAFSELYTKAQSLVSGLSSCDVRGRILNSQELVELLYIAYNREQYDIYDFENYMNKSGYQSLYSVSQDILTKRMQAINEEIERKANLKAVDAFELASDEMKRRRQILREKEENMKQYIAERAEQIVDQNSEAIGREMTRITKEKLKEIDQKTKKEEKEVIVEKKKVRRLTEEERKRRLELRRKKLMKEREANERKDNAEG